MKCLRLLNRSIYEMSNQNGHYGRPIWTLDTLYFKPAQRVTKETLVDCAEMGVLGGGQVFFSESFYSSIRLKILIIILSYIFLDFWTFKKKYIYISK